MKLFALFLWINDCPVTGTVLSLSNIVEPRKELTDYKEGELVSVRFSGFGTPKGIIGKIVEETEKKDLQAVLGNDAQFQNIVKKYTSRSVQSMQQQVEMEDIPCKKSKTSFGVKMADKKVVSEKPPCVKKVISEKPRGVEGEANELEAGSSSSSAFRKTKKQATVNLEKAAEAQRQFELASQLEEDKENLSSSSSAFVGNAFQVLNQTEPADSTDTCKGPDMNPVNLEQRLNCVDSQMHQAWQWIYELQRNVHWLHQQLNQFQNPSENQQVMPNSLRGVPAQQEVTTCSTLSGCAAEEMSLSGEERGSSDGMYNNYTKEQLWAYVEQAQDFAPVSKLLFRKLFTEEECQGRSLTGHSPNRSTPARPALENQAKLTVIYDLIQRRWPYIKRSMINAKLSELLKPSRNKIVERF